MKRFLAFVLLVMVALAPAVRLLAQEDQYVRIYSLIQEGNSLSEHNQSQALAKYLEAQAALQAFQKGYPDWNAQVVKFRLNFLASKIAALSAAAPPPAQEAKPTTATPSATQPAVAAPPKAAAAPADWEAQLGALNGQIRQLQSERDLLQAKLKEALAAQPAAVDPRELEKMEERVKELQKANELLTTSLAAEKSKPVTVVDTNAIAEARQALAQSNRQLDTEKEISARLKKDNEALQGRLTSSVPQSDLAAVRAENQLLKKELADLKAAKEKTEDPARQLAQARTEIATLQSDKELLRLEKVALENRLKTASATPPVASAPPPAKDESAAARIKQLERERDEYLKRLESANKELASRKEKSKKTKPSDLEKQVASLRAKLEVFEARPVPYTAEEMALFSKPGPKLAGASTNQPATTSTARPTSPSLVAEARRYYAARQFDKAEEKYKEILKEDAKNAGALTDLAVTQIELNRLNEAEKNLNQTLEMNPENSYALLAMGHLKFKQSKYDEALDVLSRAAKIDPQSAEVQMFLGVTLSQKGNRAAAETALRKAIQLQPGYGDAHHNLAVAYLAQQPPLIELARWHYQKALAAGHARNPNLEKLMEKKPSP